jgi:hypothetical protein
VSNVLVEDGSPEQQRVLAEILAGLGDTELELVRIGEWVDDFEEEESLGLVPTREEIEATRGASVVLVRPDKPGIRAEWELELAGYAFARRSSEEGLQRVVWIGSGWSGSGVFDRPRFAEPLTERDVGDLRTTIEAAVSDSGAGLEQLDVLRPLAHAWAAILRVEEPHAFLRNRFKPFVLAVDSWRERCAGRYIEVRDAEGSVLVLAHARSGRSSVRHDVKCCNPVVSLGTPLEAPPTPACPVFG